MQKTRKSYYFFTLALILAGFSLALFLKKNPTPQNFFLSFSRPFLSLFSGVENWTEDKLSFLSSIGKMKQKNEMLEEENLLLKSQLAKNENVKKENEELRKQLDLGHREEYQMVATFIIGHDALAKKEIVLLNRGKEAGIKNDMAVVVNEGILVGRVIEVGHQTSRVQLIIDQGFKVNAKIIDSQTRGVVEGNFGTSLQMNMIPQTAEIKIGDAVVTSEASEFFPQGLLIGYIQEKISADDQIFQSASINQPVDIGRISMVWVIIGKK